MNRILSIALTAVAACFLLGTPALAKEEIKLNIIVRDFQEDGVLFEGRITSDEGLVSDTLGSDHKPVYNLPKWQEMFGESVTQENLNAFFNDVSGVNMRTQKTITLNSKYDETEIYNETIGEYQTISGDFYIIDSAVDEMGESSEGFFPIDNELFGNEENEHNYHFSVEIHATFRYKKGDIFIFRGDDDVWVYFNNTLCVDLGGVHSEMEKAVLVDDLVASNKLEINEGDYVSFDMFYMERHLSGSNMYVKTNIDFVNFNNSDWATYELFTAYANDLIPDRLIDAELALPVYRDEFAAVAVKLYEQLANVTAEVAADNPFVDCDDTEVLKAYQLGVVKGTSANEFSPRAMLTRQEAATMLTRVYKKAKLEGWSIDKDSEFKLDTDTEKFADDALIDDWAKEGVYFMAKNGIIKGVGDNNFAPKNTTAEQEAAKYANASREQSLVISVRCFEALK
ncbi:MAG: fibro-slime domain-containing protein [Clostridia bacterium]|nr:fibro-slime domain-containing protein [Clostridia bacterium]